MRIYLLKDGQQIGPLEEDAVRAGLLSGEYSETAYALVEGEGEWRTLGEILPSLKEESPVPPLQTVLEPSPAQPTTKSSVKAIVLTFWHKLLRWFAMLGADIASIVKPALAEAKRHVHLLVLRIRLFNANHFTLRKRYYDLGRKCHEARSFETVFVQEYKELADLTQVIRNHRSKVTTPERATTIERMQVAVKNATGIVAAEALTLKFRGLFIKLGEKAAQQESAPEIAGAFEEVNRVNSDIASLEKKHATISSDCSAQEEFNNSFRILAIKIRNLFQGAPKKARSIFRLPVLRKMVLPAVICGLSILVLLACYFSLKHFWIKSNHLETPTGAASVKGGTKPLPQGRIPSKAEIDRGVKEMTMILKRASPDVIFKVDSKTGFSELDLGAGHKYTFVLGEIDPYRIFTASEEGSIMLTACCIPNENAGCVEYMGNDDRVMAGLTLPILGDPQMARDCFRKLVFLYYNEPVEKDQLTPHLTSQPGELICRGMGITAQSMLNKAYAANVPYGYERFLDAPSPEGNAIIDFGRFNPTLELWGERNNIQKVNIATRLGTHQRENELSIERHIQLATALDPNFAEWVREELHNALLESERGYSKRKDIGKGRCYGIDVDVQQQPIGQFGPPYYNEILIDTCFYNYERK